MIEKLPEEIVSPDPKKQRTKNSSESKPPPGPNVIMPKCFKSKMQEFPNPVQKKEDENKCKIKLSKEIFLDMFKEMEMD